MHPGLFTRRVPYAGSVFAGLPRPAALVTGGTPGGDGSEVLKVSTCPPGKHSLDECDEYERQWRAVAAEVIHPFVERHDRAIIQAEGPFESDGLLPLLRHVDEWNDLGLAYFVAPVDYPGGRGYTTGHAAVAYEPTAFASIVADTEIDLELVRLTLIAGPLPTGADLLRTPWYHAWPALIESGATIVGFPRHFEGCEVLGAEKVSGCVSG